MTPSGRPVLTVVTALVAAILLGLGTWQIQRLGWKQDLLAEMADRAASPARPLGEILTLPPEERRFRRVFLDPGMAPQSLEEAMPFAHVVSTDEGRSGFTVFGSVPGPGGSGRVAVAHGFVPFDERAKTYEPATGAKIEGVYRTARAPGGLAAFLAVPPDLDEGTFYDRGPALIAWLGAESATFTPFYIAQTAPVPRAPLALPEAFPRVSNRHLGYAITWYGLAGGLIGIYVLILWRSRHRD